MILDASVAAKWFLKGEEYENESHKLRQDYEEGKVELQAPSLILYEVCNSINKRIDIPRETASKLTEAASKYLSNLVISPSPQTYRKAVSNARIWDITIYDSSYATMAFELKRPLITADRDLGKRLSKISVPVVFIAKYEAA
jgi:predicted nucleic acid-binding protein